MKTFPRKCSACGAMTPEDGFHRDRSQPSGRKARCKACHCKAVSAYNDAVRRPRRLAALEAERVIELRALEVEHKKRVAEAKRTHAAGVRRQKQLLRELGVPDLSPEEVAAKFRKAGASLGLPPQQPRNDGT
jgi:hypothetical protein